MNEATTNDFTQKGRKAQFFDFTTQQTQQVIITIKLQ